MAYVDAMFDRDQDIIRVVERKDGKRDYREYQAKYTFYYEDQRGKYKSVYGDPLSRIVCKNTKDFRKEVAINKSKNLFESDINPIFQCLSENYLNQDAPKLNIAFFDIETDFDPERGFADPSDPFMPITSISVYLQWLETMVCLAVPPKTLTMEQAKKELEGIENVMLFEKEGDMIDTFLTLIEDADILSGWNSEGYDIPYTVNRTSRVLSKDDTRRFCLWGQLPKKREYEKYGKSAVTFDLIGRVHLDSLNLYRKYTYEERHTYRLDAIGEIEVGENKVPYEGTLDQLYNNDFRKFIEYNIQDTALLDKLDKKLRFIDLSNTVAHENTVLLQTTMGAVAVTEQAIVNEAHHRGLQVPNRKKYDDEATQAAGAYVAFPKKGLHKWIGSMDLNSLYPSVIRALNMAPETIIGQIRPEHSEQRVHEDMTLKKKSFAGSWEGRFATEEYEAVMEKRKDIALTVEFENGNTEVLSGAEIYNAIFDSNQPWMLSANGTIFTTEFEGVIPGLLKRWYSERKDLQKMLKKAKDAGNAAETEYWDKRQLVKKINLNSLYGAILNPGCRFYDKRIGQSTTLTGRMITRHMGAETNRMLTGEYDHEGATVVYGDTDSVYFSATPVLEAGQELDMDSAIALYDKISDDVSNTFPGFLKKEFNVPLQAGQVMKAGREVVGRSGVFITKKRYAIKCLDIEGYQPEGGKLKIMGMDIKRSDTPEFVQDFLEGLLDNALSGHTEDQIIEQIKEFRDTFKNMDPWRKGMPKRVNNLTTYGEKLSKMRGKDVMKVARYQGVVKENNMIPGHVRASINWNEYKSAMSDNYSQSITDGMKVVVCKLRKNAMGYTNIAYPTDEQNLPDWFRELPFDDEGMLESVLEKKIQNVLGAMNFNLDRATEAEALQEFFDFG